MEAERNLCEHGRIETGYCEECEVKRYFDPIAIKEAERTFLENDHVGHPCEKASRKQIGGDHYKTMAIQPSLYIFRNKLDWYEGNAVKYITRHRVKGGKEDILKAIHYLEMLLEEEYG